MNRAMHRFVLALCALSPVAHAGTTLTWQRQKGDEAASTLTMKCEAGNARFDGASARNRVVLWDAKAKTLTILNGDDKTYSQLTEAKLAAMREKAKTMMEGMKARLATMPAEQRARTEKMMAQLNADDGKGPTPWQFKATGKKSKAGKYDCELYDAARGEAKVQFCLVPWDKAPARKEDLECLKSIASVFGSMLRQAARDGENPAEDLSSFPGMPVQTLRDVGDGKRLTSTLVGVDKSTVPPDAFAVPADYRLVEIEARER